MQQTTRSTVYWPGIDTDIEDFIHRCPAFLSTKPHNKWQPLIPYAILDGPWLKSVQTSLNSRERMLICKGVLLQVPLY